MTASFIPFIQAVGRGVRAGRHLTQEEAKQAMSMILNNEVTPDQRGAFLMLMRVREETAEEIAGFTQACREKLQSGLASLKIDIDIACYAGKRRQLPWFLLSSLMLAQLGYRVFLHGTQEPHTSRLYLSEVCRALNLPMANNISEANQTMSANMLYMDMSTFHDSLNNIIQLRSQFGLRSCANTLARLLNPSNAPFSIQGVHHLHLDHKHLNVAKLTYDKNILCFRGEGGEPEINPCKPTELLICRTGKESIQTVEGEDKSWAIKPKSLDIDLLKKVWKKETVHEYGENAVVKTLAAYLSLVKSMPISDALLMSYKLWSQRDTTWPESKKQ